MCNSNGFNRCITEWNKALRVIMRIPYRSHRWLLGQLGQQRNFREHLHLKQLRYLTYAINHCNVKMFAHITLGCVRSATGANIALLRHYYGVCFDRNTSLNKKSICKLYKMNKHSEQRATVNTICIERANLL